MRVETKEEIDSILNYCRAERTSMARPGGGFYTLMEQDFLYKMAKYKQESMFKIERLVL